MAHYLPVLLVSVSTNAISDDSSVSTLPRGQVDYLSHEWQEEDVWRSWRNMTRQKNEIANGMRLENASWRTWWKQRNKLKTISPETLNWLKDCDVTWLYGPLHTAVDWTPPPKPTPPPTSVDGKEASAHDRLDLSIASALPPRHKPILKYRSISELLTSDLPPSPVFSPAESEDEAHRGRRVSSPHSALERGPEQADERPKRPMLMHTKSDTHVSRWGPNRAYRRDSPPRIDPPGHEPTNDVIYLQRQDSRGKSKPHSHPPARRKHIIFNTYVEQCIAIEKPRKTGFRFGDDIREGGWDGKTPRWDFDDGYEEDQEDDYDQTSLRPASNPMRGYPQHIGESAIQSDSDSPDDEVFDDDDEASYDEDEGEEPDVDSGICISQKRSQSKVSTSSSSSGTTSASSPSSSPSRRKRRGAVHPPPRKRRGSVYATYSPKTHTVTTPANVSLPISTSSSERASSASRTSPEQEQSRPRLSPRSEYPHHLHHHVTIAPIPPTILKTSGAGEDDERDPEFGSLAASYAFVDAGFDMDCHDKHNDGRPGLVPLPPFGWREGFGDELGDMGSDDGFGDMGVFGPNNLQTRRNSSASRSRDKGRPVDLVYVPPVASQYNVRLPRSNRGPRPRRQHDPQALPDSTLADLETQTQAPTDPSSLNSTILSVAIPAPTQAHDSLSSIPVPVVVVPCVDNPPADAYDYFVGPDLGEDFPRRRGRSERRTSSGELPCLQSSSSITAERPSRSRSNSRTPSPAVLASSTPVTSSPADATGAIPVPIKRSASVSPPSPASSLLSPPVQQRGRSIGTSSSFGQSPSQQEPRRGRSASRSSPSSLEERSRSRSSHGGSPLGSLSPDGVPGSYSGYSRTARGASESRRSSERGRDVTKKRLSQGSSSSAGSSAGSLSTTPNTIATTTAAAGQKICSTPSMEGNELGSMAIGTQNADVTTAVPGLVDSLVSVVEVLGENQKANGIITTILEGNVEGANLDVESTSLSIPAFTPKHDIPHQSGDLFVPGEDSSTSNITSSKVPCPAGISRALSAQLQVASNSVVDASPSVSSESASNASYRASVEPAPHKIDHSPMVSTDDVPSVSESVFVSIGPTAVAPTSPSLIANFPIILPPPQPAEPSTSYSISPPGDTDPTTPTSSLPPNSPSSSKTALENIGLGKGVAKPRQMSASSFSSLSTHERRDSMESTSSTGTGIVGKAVEIVSSAGAFLGLWNGTGMPNGSNGTGGA